MKKRSRKRKSRKKKHTPNLGDAEKLNNEKDYMQQDIPLSFFDNKMEYRGYRLSYLMKQCKEFRRNEEWTGFGECLEELLRFVSENPPILKKILKEQLKIWEAQKKATEIYQNKSFKKRAEVCQEVTDLTTPPDYPTTSKKALKLRKNMKIEQANWNAQEYKWLAFDAMDKRKPSLDELSKAIEHMEVAIKHEKEACSLAEGERGESQLRYFSYWRNVFMERRESMEKRFDTAVQALNQAIEDAKFFTGRDTKLFPNYYPNLDALVNEQLFIEAYRLLWNRDYFGCLEKLKEWLDKSECYKDTSNWRYNNVKIRYLVVQALLQLPNKISSKDVKEEIDKFWNELLLGGAAVNLANILFSMAVESEQPGGLSKEREKYFVEQICQSFAIDYLAKNDFTDISIPLFEKKDLFDYLPQYFTDIQQQIYEVEDPVEGFGLVDDWLKNYLVVIAEYYYLKCYEQGDVIEDFDPAFDKKSIEQLNEIIKRMIEDHCHDPGESKKGRRAFKTVQKYLNQKKEINLSDKKGLENLKIITQLAYRVILSTVIDFFPQIILVKDKKCNELERTIYKCERIWKDQYPRFFELYGEKTLNVGKYYYLPSEWKNKKHKVISSERTNLDVLKSELFERCILGRINFNTKGLKEVKIAIVQLETKDESLDDNFRIKEEFRSERKEKILNYFDKAINEGAQVVVFPELSVPEDILGNIELRVKELKREKGYDVFVIAGTHYDADSCNVCPVITPYGIYNQYKRNPSEPEKGTMKIKDRRTIIFRNTGFGDFAVLICLDFTSDRLIFDLKNNIDFLFVISRNKDVEQFKKRSEYFTVNNYCYIVSANDDIYGGSAFYGPFKHKWL